MSSDRTPADVARLFHETYERLAPEFGYRTREASAVPWDEVPETNRALMIATVTEVLAGFRVTPKPDDTTRAAIKPFYAIQRADGDLIYSELGWLGVAGPDDWSYVEYDDPDPPTTYEMVRMQGEVVARRIFGTLMCDCPDADCVRCDGGVIDLGKLPYDAAAPYLSGDREGRPDTCPTCGTDCEQFGRCPDPWHDVGESQ